MRTHDYAVQVSWTGAARGGTTAYRAYSREHAVEFDGGTRLTASADPAFLGDAELVNPEELLLASLSQCHMLWYLGLCASSGVVVTAYRDAATGTMTERPDGGGAFTEVVLHPEVQVAEAGMVSAAERLHEQANRKCFIANSVNFPVRHQPTISTGG
ncbi:OsmC family protein [Saccharopolyspora sp. HNM0983]|uniref:OsmC family protein n=1 Tax=Saccharopolyspora montiporae TaxID=2781240 RepID=A0A929BEZ2_9PSEU|nr:OsmC family protein [Saccharopolyspora sp. HNM0983]MBE9376353.1 OsmC family protein [Saccharopolyspora sp. HNM0983]